MALRSDPALKAATHGRARVERVTRWILVTDLLVVLWAVLGAQALRFGTTSGATGTTSTWDLEYTWVSAGIVVLWVLLLRLHGAYDPRMFGHGIQEYRSVGNATFRLFAALAIVSYLAKLELARGYVLVAFPAGLLVLLLTRRMWRTWLGSHRARGDYVDLVLVVGDAPHLRTLIRDLRAAPEAGFAVVGACCSDDVTTIDGIPVVGTEDEAAAFAERLDVDVLACSVSGRRGADGLRRLSWALEGTGVELVVSPGLTDVAGPRIRSRPVAGLPLIYVEEPTFTGAPLLLKSALDVAVAGSLMLVLFPVFALVALLVWLEDRGPVFYSQDRVGIHGRRFVMHKFRSMRVGADTMVPTTNEGAGPLFKMREDPRVTRIGRFIRRYSLDELPQFWNIIRRDMSLVGPRPPLASEVAVYEEDVHRRLLVKPGLTGLWQVSGRSDLSWEDSVRLDLYYVENWSFTTDLRILWRTARAVFDRRGAY